MANKKPHSMPYICVAAHIGTQCMGPPSTENGPETDPMVILWEQLELSLTIPLGITPWSAVWAAW